MSMPSDVTPDITDAMEAARDKIAHVSERAGTSQLTSQQVGLAAAALVAFLGITYLGPAITRFRRRPTARERMARRLRQARRQAEQARGRLKKRVRQLGGGTILRR